MNPSKPTPPQRRNVADELVVSQGPPERSWNEMASAGKEIANYELWLAEQHLAKNKRDGRLTPLDQTLWERYREAMAVIKANCVEARQQSGNNFDPSKLTTEQLAEIAK